MFNKHIFVSCVLAFVCLRSISCEKPAESPQADKQVAKPPVEKFLQEIADSNNFSAEMQIGNGSGPYAVHLGQIHINRKNEISTLWHEPKIIKAQKGIERIIVGLQKSGQADKNVYLEGLCDSDKEIDEQMESLKKIFAIEPTYTNYLRLMQEIASAELRGNYKLAYFLRLKLGQMDEQHPELGQKHRDMDEALNKMAELKPDPAQKKFKYDMDQMYSNQDKYFDYGTIFAMHREGLIRVKAAESEKFNDRGFEIGDQIELFELKHGPNITEKKVQQELDKLKTAEEKAVYHDREDLAVKLMAKSLNRSKPYTVFIYGDGHNFQRAFDEHNLAHPNEKIGLIKLSPKNKP